MKYTLLAVFAAVLFAGTALCAAPQKKAHVPAKADLEKIYKSTPEGELKLYIYRPANWKKTDKRPLMLMYHGGGWRGGDPSIFFDQCRYYADQGFVAISAQYRKADQKLTFDNIRRTVVDAVSAIRYVRKNAAELGIDPAKVICAGSSAGGHISLCVALMDQVNDPADDLSIDRVPNALLLLCPVVHCGPAPGYAPAYRAMKEQYPALSPAHHLRSGMPPQLIVSGSKDHVIPAKYAYEYAEEVRKTGSVCEVKIYEGAKHGAFYRGKYLKQAQPVIDAFLKAQKLWPENESD